MLVSFFFIRRKELPFEMKPQDIKIDKWTLYKVSGLGAPIALQDLLVSISFLIILAIVNSMGITASAGGEWQKIMVQATWKGQKRRCITEWQFLFSLV